MFTGSCLDYSLTLVLYNVKGPLSCFNGVTVKNEFCLTGKIIIDGICEIDFNLRRRVCVYISEFTILNV